jgi:hypothetical protein
MKKVILSVLLISLFILSGLNNASVMAGTSAKAIATVSAAAALQSGTEVVPADTNAASTETKDKPFDWKGLIIGILILAFFTYMVVWMIITLVKTKKIEEVTQASFKTMRKAANKSEEASEEENKQAFAYMEDAFYSWKIVSGPEEEEMRSPTTMGQIRKSRELHANAVALMPTDQVVVDRLNELGNVINFQEKRSFAGSWKLIGVAVVAMLIMYFMTKSSTEGFWHFMKGFWWMPVSIILYYIASLTPAFLQDKRARWFKGKNVHNVLIGTILGLFLATPATETWVTKWSDGRKTKSEEMNPLFFVMVILTFMMILILGFMTIIFAGLNFIRNYVVYV